MELLAGPYVAAAALLVAGGAPKLWSPADTANALRGLRLPSGRPLVRVLGAAEVVTGVAALVTGSAIAATATAAWYAVFAAVVALALRSGKPIASCGCFGKADTPPTRAHLLLVAAASVTAAAYATGPVANPLSGQPAYGLPFLLLTGCVAWFGYLVMSRLAVLRDGAGGVGVPASARRPGLGPRPGRQH